MAAGSTYPASFLDTNGNVREGQILRFDDSANQPQAGGNTITSGTLPNTGSWVSGTAKVNPVARAITVAVEVVSDGTNNIATCAIAISADDSTYTTIGTPGTSAAVNAVGAVTLLTNVPLPQGWFIKLTLSHTVVAASKYW